MIATLQKTWSHLWPWVAVLGFFAVYGLVGDTVGGL